MARKENANSVPAFVNYGEVAAVPRHGTSQSAPSASVTAYWKQQLVKKHRTTALPLTIKEKALWKRLIEQYSEEDLFAMIDVWMDGKHDNHSHFVRFYSNIGKIQQYMVKHSIGMDVKDYKWD
jgi:hypothetical protein